MLMAALALRAAPALALGTGEPQSFSPTGPPQTEVVLSKLHDPVYPQIARTAHISGDIKLTLQVRLDGSVQSVEYVSGSPLLYKVAADSAQASQFECRGCTQTLTAYSMVYTFELTDGDCCKVPSGSPSISVLESRILISAPEVCLCDPVATKVRSIKCFYLWKCGWR